MSRVRAFYDKNFLAVEFCISVAVLLTVVLPFELYFGRDVLFSSVDKNRAGLYGTAASVAGSLLGFVISAVSVILVFGQHLHFLKESGQYPTVFEIFFQSILWLAAATVWAFVGLLVDTAGSGRIWILYGMIWLGVLASLRVYRCVWILKQITMLAIKNSRTD